MSLTALAPQGMTQLRALDIVAWNEGGSILARVVAP